MRGHPASTLITQNRIAIARGETDVTELANRAGNIFSLLNQWVIDMQNSVIAHEGVQALLDMSRPLLCNPVVLMDMTYKVLAHTIYRKPGDGEESLSGAGFSLENLSGILNAGLAAQEQADDAIILTAPGALPCPALRKRFNLSEAFSIYAVMLCTHREPSPGLMGLFSLLCQYVTEYIRQGYPHEGKYSAFDSLLQDFLGGRLQDAGDIALRASHASLSSTGLFDLYKILLTNAESQPLAYQSAALQEKLPNSRVSFYQKAIVVLNLYEEESTYEEMSRGTLRIIDEALGGHIQGIGVSNLFFHPVRAPESL